MVPGSLALISHWWQIKAKRLPKRELWRSGRSTVSIYHVITLSDSSCTKSILNETSLIHYWQPKWCCPKDLTSTKYINPAVNGIALKNVKLSLFSPKTRSTSFYLYGPFCSLCCVTRPSFSFHTPRKINNQIKYSRFPKCFQFWPTKQTHVSNQDPRGTSHQSVSDRTWENLPKPPPLFQH